MKKLNELTREAYALAKSKGFWDTERNKSELLMLIVSELGEAMEAHRKGDFATTDLFSTFEEDDWKEGRWAKSFETHIKDTFEDELADALIRMCDFCGGYEIPLKYDDQMIIFMTSVKLEENVGSQLLDMTEQITFLNKNLDRRTFETEFCYRFVAMLLAFCKKLEIDIERHVELKMKYNATREHLHGKKY